MTQTTTGHEDAPRPRHFRWGLSALLLSLVILGLVAWRVLLLRSTTVSATLRVASVPRTILGEVKGEGVDVSTYQHTTAALMKDRLVLAHAAQRPEVVALATVQRLVWRGVDVADWLARNLNVSFRDRSEVLEVSLSGDNPEDLAVLVDAVVDAYMNGVVKAESAARLVRLEKLREVWGRYQRELKNKRRSVEELENLVPRGDAGAAMSGFDLEEFREYRVHVRQELLRAEQARAAAKARLDRRSNDGVNQSERERLADEIVAHEAEVQFLKQELERLQPKQSPQPKSIDLAAERTDIAIAEERVRAVGATIDRMQIELDAPDRVSLLSRAGPTRAGSRWKQFLAGW